MTLKLGKLTLDKQTVRSLRARSSIRAGFGNPDPAASNSGVELCMVKSGDDSGAAPAPAPAPGGFVAKKQPDPIYNPGKLLPV